MENINLMLGDNIESLKKLNSNSVDSIVTDPPYGLSFMNKKWDYQVPSVEFWKEVYRVLKPGGHILSFGGTRTYHRMVVNIEDAGFEIRDQIMWIYGSGFPKSHNIGKSVDKLEGNEREVVDKIFPDGSKPRETQQLKIYNENEKYIGNPKYTKGTSPYEGWGTALKPANEPICLARKPLSEKTIAENVLKWGTGGINIDGCRIGTDDKLARPINDANNNVYGEYKSFGNNNEPEGRFPANIIFECICDEVIKGEKGEVKKSGGSRDGLDITHEWGYGEINRTTYTDKGDIHTNPDCPCRLLDEQSGESKSPNKSKTGTSKFFKGVNENEVKDCFGDKGGASRFFYIAKVSKNERNLGMDGFEEKSGDTLVSSGHNKTGKGRISRNPEKDTQPKKNNHPTVKPINLMTYLCRLITPKGGTVLDPFMGSGSSGISARLEGFNFIGMEMDEDYFKIAEARINNFEQYRKLLK